MELKNARNRAGLSQEQVARRVGIALRTYIRYERRERPVPLEVALPLAEMLGVPLEALVLHHETDVNGGESPEVITQTGIAPKDRTS